MNERVERRTCMFEILKTYIRQTWLVLLLACGLSASLAGVDSALRERITGHARQRLERAVVQVVPGAAASQPVTRAGQTVYRVTDASGGLCGWATVAEGRGFQDRIRILVGLSADGETVTGLKILDSNETPGLGDRIQQPAFLDQFVNRAVDQPFARVKPGASSASPIHALTGATISSQAVIDTINDQLASIRTELGSSVAAETGP